MPSATPAGSGTLTVTYAGKSVSSPVTVLVSAFGISNLRVPSGHETAAVAFGTNENEVVSVLDAAAPGDVLVLLGTGLGPSIGDIDTNYPIQGNLGTAPIVYVGEVPSPNVSYYGRTPIYPGLDEIIFTVPMNAPLGCHVSIIVQTANLGVPIVSNVPNTAIAATDHTPCTDPVNGFPAAALADPASSNNFVVSLIENQSFLPSTPGGTIPSKPVIADTYQILAPQFTPFELFAVSLTLAEASQGTCEAGFAPNVATPATPPPATYLNIGNPLTLTPPSGSPIVLPAALPGIFVGADSLGIAPGTWTLATPGGANEGPLNLNFKIPQPVTWTNQASLTGATINRANGLTLTWSGGDGVNGFVDIQGFAANTTGTFLIGYDCSAPISAGSFTVPPAVLLRMPTGVGANATLQLSTYAYPSTISPIQGFNDGNFSQIQTIIPIVYQ